MLTPSIDHAAPLKTLCADWVSPAAQTLLTRAVPATLTYDFAENK